MNSMSDHPKSTPSSSSTPSPSTSEGRDESAGFREALLQLFFHPEDAVALRRLGGMLHARALALAPVRPEPADYGLWADVRAVAADLRYAEGFLVLLGGERGDVMLSAEDAALSAVAARQAAEVGRIAEALEKAAA
jgi:hypothetical protein